ncbi:MAG: DUF4352 domain-containing protein [Nanoarchaeota archaeon]
MKVYALLLIGLLFITACTQAVPQCPECKETACPSTKCQELDCNSCPPKVEIKTEIVEKIQYVCPDESTIVSNIIDCKKKFFGNVTYNFKDEIVAGDFKWTFLSNKELKSFSGGMFSGMQVADGTYLIIEVEVENLAKKAAKFDNTLMKLEDIQGREFLSDNDATGTYNGESFTLFSGFGDAINPGIKKRGFVLFDIPENLEDLKIVVASNSEINDIFNINLRST